MDVATRQPTRRAPGICSGALSARNPPPDRSSRHTNGPAGHRPESERRYLRCAGTARQWRTVRTHPRDGPTDGFERVVVGILRSGRRIGPSSSVVSPASAARSSRRPGSGWQASRATSSLTPRQRRSAAGGERTLSTCWREGPSRPRLRPRHLRRLPPRHGRGPRRGQFCIDWAGSSPKTPPASEGKPNRATAGDVPVGHRRQDRRRRGCAV